jgi:uncharacterized membrane protein
MRRGVAGPLLVTLVVAAVTHLAVLAAIPPVVMGEALRVAAAGSGRNVMAFPDRATDQTRVIARPSPDYLYATCVFDLADGPVRIDVPQTPDGYASIALYADNTDNFAVLGDQGERAGSLAVTVARAGQTSLADMPVVVSPSVRGLALVRLRISDESALAAMDATRHEASCHRL